MVCCLLMKNGPYELVIAPPEYPGKKYRGRYCYEHHLVWWQNTGGLPGPGEVVHHKNEDKRDNSYGNLEKKTGGKHTADHHVLLPLVRLICPECGTQFRIKGSIYRQRLKQQIQYRGNEKADLYCSRSCQVTSQQRNLWDIPE